MNKEKEDRNEINDSIDWLCNPQLEINDYTSKYNYFNEVISNNDILHNNMQAFITHYGVFDIQTQNIYIKDIRTLIFDCIQINNVKLDNINQKSKDIFKQMNETVHCCNHNFFKTLDILDTV